MQQSSLEELSGEQKSGFEHTFFPQHFSETQIFQLRRGLGAAFGLHLLAGAAALSFLRQVAPAESVVLWLEYFLFTLAVAACLSLVLTRPGLMQHSARRVFHLLCWITIAWSSAWALASILTVGESLVVQMAVKVIVIALAAGVSQILGMYFPLVACFVVCTILPISVSFFMAGTPVSALLGIFALVFLGIYLVTCFVTSRSLLAVHELKNRQDAGSTALKQQMESETAIRSRMEKALVLAQQACADKTRFLAIASHDLRQPVHAISLFVAALKSEKSETKVRDLVDCLDRSLVGLDSLFNRLLDISRLDSGLITPHVREFYASSVAQTLETRFAPLAHAKGLRFRVHCPASLVIRSDYELLVELVSNLLANAVRYTDSGGILLAFRPKGNRVSVQVLDTGCGITSNNLGLIFNEFVQLDNPSGNPRGGLGLGLSIVKRLCEIMGHRINVQSVPGKGSRFEIEAERAAQLGPKQCDMIEQRQPAKDLGGMLVLVVDDDDDILVAMDAVLRSWGCYTITAHDVDEALANIESSPRFPDILVTDHRLANYKTSFDVVKAVGEVLPADIPVVVVSGESNLALKNQILGMGWHFMSKPVTAAHLHNALSRVLEDFARTSKKVA